MSPLRRSSRLSEQRNKCRKEDDESLCRKGLQLLSKENPSTQQNRLKDVCSYFEALPDEIILSIFKLLPTTTLARTAQVSKRWQRISYDPIFWKTAVFTEHDTLKAGTLSHVLARGCQNLRIKYNCQIHIPIFTDETPEESYGLKRIDFRSGAIMGKELCAILSRCGNLTHVVVRGVDVDDNICMEIAKCPNMTEVFFRPNSNFISFKGYQAIFRGCPRIEKFNALEGLTRFERLICEVTELIEELPPSLKDMSFYNWRNSFNDKHVEQLVRKAPTLTHLSLRGSRLLTGGAVEPLTKLAHLVKLDLSYCYMIPHEKLSGLASCKSLQELVMVNIRYPNGNKLAELLPHVKVTFSSLFFARMSVSNRRY